MSPSSRDPNAHQPRTATREPGSKAPLLPPNFPEEFHGISPTQYLLSPPFSCPICYVDSVVALAFACLQVSLSQSCFPFFSSFQFLWSALEPSRLAAGVYEGGLPRWSDTRLVSFPSCWGVLRLHEGVRRERRAAGCSMWFLRPNRHAEHLCALQPQSVSVGNIFFQTGGCTTVTPSTFPCPTTQQLFPFAHTPAHTTTPLLHAHTLPSPSPRTTHKQPWRTS